MPREYGNGSKPDKYVIWGNNSNLCILNKFSCHKTSQRLLLMKTKKILSHLGINHTGKQQMGNSTNYLSSDIPPNSHNNAKQGQKSQIQAPNLTTFGKNWHKCQVNSKVSQTPLWWQRSKQWLLLWGRIHWKGHKVPFSVQIMFTLIWVELALVYLYVKFHWVVLVRLMHFTACKLYLNKTFKSKSTIMSKSKNFLNSHPF